MHTSIRSAVHRFVVLTPLLLIATPQRAAAGAVKGTPVAVFVTLGTGGGPLTRLKRSEPANAVIVGDSVYLFDVGDGVQRQMEAAGIALASVKAIFISHHHLDHDAGLGPIMASRWLMNVPGKLPVLGPPGTIAMVNGLGAAYAPIDDASQAFGNAPTTPIADSFAPEDLAAAMDEPTLVYQDADIRVLAVTNTHYHARAGRAIGPQTRSYSYRIEAGGRSFVYTGDTGPSAHVVSLAKGADVLVSEVVDLASVRAVLARNTAIPPFAYPIITAHMVEDHLVPEEVGRIAAAAGVKDVVLTHLTMGMDDETSTAGYTAGIAPTFKGRVRVANDLDRF